MLDRCFDVPTIAPRCVAGEVEWGRRESCLEEVQQNEEGGAVRLAIRTIGEEMSNLRGRIRH